MRKATSALAFCSAAAALATLFVTWETITYTWTDPRGLTDLGTPPPPLYTVFSDTFPVKGLAEILMGCAAGLCVAAFVLSISAAARHPRRIMAGLCTLGGGLAVVSFPWPGPNSAQSAYLTGQALSHSSLILDNWFPTLPAGAFLALACALVITGVALLLVRQRRRLREKGVVILMVLAAGIAGVAILRMLFSDDRAPGDPASTISSWGVGIYLAGVVVILCVATAAWSAVLFSRLRRSRELP